MQLQTKFTFAARKRGVLVSLFSEDGSSTLHKVGKFVSYSKGSIGPASDW